MIGKLFGKQTIYCFLNYIRFPSDISFSNITSSEL